jgi:hypothetical protein
MLLDQVDALNTQIGKLTSRIGAIPAAQGIDDDGTAGPCTGTGPSAAVLSPRVIQSGPRSRGGKTGRGNAYLKGVLGEAAAAAARTDTFPACRRHPGLSRYRSTGRRLDHRLPS